MTAVDFVAFVDELAGVSGDAVLPFFRTALSIDNKHCGGGFDPVTAADRAAEAAMRTLIRRTFPAHGIVGEEYGEERTDADYVWVLDPIDGTKSFVCGMMHPPFLRERFSGDGEAARYRGPRGARDLRVRDCAELAEAVLLTTSP